LPVWLTLTSVFLLAAALFYFKELAVHDSVQPSSMQMVINPLPEKLESRKLFQTE
jgi:hypothetical protein